jgi:cysteinyl-tRNA synthetase
MLQAHYRSILDFSDDAIVAAEKGYKRLMEAMHLLKEISASAKSTIDIPAWKQFVMMR